MTHVVHVGKAISLIIRYTPADTHKNTKLNTGSQRTEGKGLVKRFGHWNSFVMLWMVLNRQRYKLEGTG